MNPFLHNRPLCALAVALLCFSLAACGGRRPTDAMDAARAAVEGASGAERCAEAEFRAARSLLEQANAAYEAGDYAEARRLAEAAQAQAERAERIAEENLEDCERVEDVIDQVEERQAQPDRPEAVDTDHQFVAIHFDFDASTLSAEARRILDGHARALNNNAGWRVTVEGHCDERGSVEYNLALGESRARSVAAYLQRMGVSAQRINTVSYGAEMPVSTDWNINRRAEFRVTGR